MTDYSPKKPRRHADPRTATDAWPALLARLAGAVTPCDDATEWISESEKHQDRAAELCGACVALRECRRYALVTRQPAGVWGGTTPKQRAALYARESA